MYRVVETQWRGVQRLTSRRPLDACLATRLARMEKRLVGWVPMLPTIARHAVNAVERERARSLERAITERYPLTVKDRVLRTAVRMCRAAWAARVRLFGDGLQPATIVTHYPAGRRIAAPVLLSAYHAKPVEAEARSQVG